jgi:hypothetical protein
MSEKDLILQDKEYNFDKIQNISFLNAKNVKTPRRFLQNQTLLYIRFPNNKNHIDIKVSSIKRILSNGKLEQTAYISFNLDIDPLSLEKGETKRKEKETNEETTEDEEESISIKDEANIQSPKNINLDKQVIILDVKNKNENIFNSKLPLLKNKISNTFSNIENLPKKYINLIIFYNKFTINIDSLKCLYLTIFFCGLFNLLYFFDLFFDKNRSLDYFYYILYFPLAVIFISTGIYGYKKVKENIYDSEICLRLTYLSLISPIFIFILSKICSEISMKRNTMLNLIINFISSLFSFFCITILKEVERVNNSEKNILNA